MEITSQSMLDSLASGEKSRLERLEINGYPALRHEITGTVDLTRLMYVQTTIEGKDAFYQVLGWTLASRADKARGFFDTATETFRELQEPLDKVDRPRPSG